MNEPGSFPSGRGTGRMSIDGSCSAQRRSWRSISWPLTVPCRERPSAVARAALPGRRRSCRCTSGSKAVRVTRPGSFRDALRRVWALCNELPEEALGCFDFDIYAHPGWQAVRREAGRRCGRTVGTASVATPRSCATTVGSVCMATRRNEKPPLGRLFVALRRTAYSPFFALNSRRRRCRTGSV